MNDNTAEQLKCREAFEKWYANRYGEYQPNNLKDATWHAWKAAKTTDVQTSSTVSEVEALRAAQSRDVMPLIGSLLDSFELLANDLKTDPDLKELVRGLHAIERAMLAAEPNGERIEQVSQQEVNGIPVPVTIDRTHANRAYVTLGFADSSFCTDFIKAAERGFRPINTRADSGDAVAWTSQQDIDYLKCCEHAGDIEVYAHPCKATPIPLFTHPSATSLDMRKAFAFDALVAAGFVTQGKADESLAIAEAALSQRVEKGKATEVGL